MCLILIAWQAQAAFPLVVAANRDEFHLRPTAPAAWWSDQPQLLGGRDLAAGGTWMGVTRCGRFAALTNFRDPARMRQDAPSRGHLVSDFLAGPATPLEYLARISRDDADYNGYNLLVGDLHQLCWHSNVGGQTRTLGPGVYGLSNELLDSPWPKVVAAKSALALALDHLPAEAELFGLLANQHRYADETLPDTGVGRELERMLSAAFILSERRNYGTRSSTILLRDAGGRVRLDEQGWLADGSSGERRRYAFALDQNLGRQAADTRR